MGAKWAAQASEFPGMPVACAVCPGTFEWQLQNSARAIDIASVGG